MKTISQLFRKLFKKEQMTDAQLDAWIISIRQKPQLSTTTYNDVVGIEDSEILVLA